MSVEKAQHYQSQSERVTMIRQKMQNQTWVIMGTDLLEIKYAEKDLGILHQHQTGVSSILLQQRQSTVPWAVLTRM